MTPQKRYRVHAGVQRKDKFAPWQPSYPCAYIRVIVECHKEKFSRLIISS